MEKDLVSVIIAAYNAEPYLSRCLDSVLNQTYRNIEVIVIDDASTDNTLSILKAYATKDSRITVLKMEKNSGAPAARNKGKAVAKGAFVTTIDADDAIAEDAIESSVKEMKNNPELDVVIYSVIRIEQETGKRTPFPINKNVPNRPMTGEEACYWSLQWDIPGFSLTRSPLELDMQEETTYGQYGDETTTHLLFLKARKVMIGKGVYYYYQNPASYTKKVSYKRFEILECRLSMKRHLVNLGADSKLIKRYEVKRWRDLIGSCFLYWKNKKAFTEEERCNIEKRLQDNYATFRFANLPITEALKPRFVMLPTFKLFYLQLCCVFKLGLIHTDH